MPRRFRSAFSLCPALLFVLFALQSSSLIQNRCFADDTSEEGFKPAFNGKDLTGWVAVNTAPSTWKMQDGMLVCSGKPIGELRTARMYQNFVMELEWRHMVPRGNAGVFVWADDITARGVPFHRGIEVQVLENAYGNTKSHTTHGDIFPIHGAKMTPVNGRGGSRAFPTEERSKPSPGWNHYRITCQDGHISLAVNGKVVTQGTDCSPRKGYICLESEGGIVHYRNVKIKELPDTPIADEHVAIANRNYRCLYTGVDFSGWHIGKNVTGNWKSNDWVFSYDGKAPVGESAIETVDKFEDFGFVFDIRRKENSGVVQISLRDSKGTTINIDPSNEDLQKHLGGGWNRFEGTLIGNILNLSVNGESAIINRELNDTPRKGRLRIAPDGPVDFANIYVRKL
ncbi:MAG: family 16 glycoside hydrolase [Planctomycetales bacterium]